MKNTDEFFKKFFLEVSSTESILGRACKDVIKKRHSFCLPHELNLLSFNTTIEPFVDFNFIFTSLCLFEHATLHDLRCHVQFCHGKILGDKGSGARAKRKPMPSHTLLYVGVFFKPMLWGERLGIWEDNGII